MATEAGSSDRENSENPHQNLCAADQTCTDCARKDTLSLALQLWSRSSCETRSTRQPDCLFICLLYVFFVSVALITAITAVRTSGRLPSVSPASKKEESEKQVSE